ncbi:MAG: NFACT RNA binding domain-containing protein [Finegoldia magna]|uniref:Rqc2 family fibronectin-binding protein n=1 Tax=Finegoldia magna TaxID=1260 RepID=UPI002910FF6C|nr:NFACT RNA binding domain-containing protein [Finegoldia magna]MDU5273173.1 NFACT RNA binding domain-containing protein [Finegoldia magna]MDU5922317.1 NFACT RNA binding domain-containing protein [Finegoldia magna]MDU5970767.1 NFACT RNA binding domain-containing protein [Finegoldia magna]
MSFDGIVTKAIVDDIKEKLINGKISKVNQPDKNELDLIIYNNKQNYKLLISASSSLPRMHFTNENKKNPIEAYNFCMLMRKYLQGAVITDIYQESMDRVVSIDINSRDEMGYDMNYTLVVELMGKHSNIILIEKESQMIVDAIKRISFDTKSIRQILPKTKYSYLEDDKINILKSDDLPINIAEGTTKLQQVFYKNYTGFSPTISREICLRADLDYNIRLEDLNDDEKSRFNQVFIDIREDIRNCDYEYSIVIDEDEKLKDFHVIKLEKYGYLKKNFDDIHEMLDYYYKKHSSNDSITQKSSHLKKIVSNKIQRNSNKLSNLTVDLQEAKKRDIYKVYADLISSNMHLINKGMDKITVDNFYDDMNPIEIPLNPIKSGNENAQIYYKRFSKLKTREKMITQELPLIKQENEYLLQLLETLERITEYQELSEIKDEMVKIGLIKKSKKKTAKVKPSKPRHFVTENNVDIFVGKNNYQNDNLTLKQANREDIFVHVKDMPGSHVIMRNENLIQKDYDVACFLAAYFSSMSKEKYVEVDYTEKKNVKKAKGAKPGMVFYNNFNTVNVDMSSFNIDNIKEIV